MLSQDLSHTWISFVRYRVLDRFHTPIVRVGKNKKQLEDFSSQDEGSQEILSIFLNQE